MEKGSSQFLKPGQEVRLEIRGNSGRVEQEAAFTVREDELFHTFGVVRRTGPEFKVALGNDGVLPWEKQNGDPERPYNNVCAVRRQGVVIEHKPSGRKIEIIYQRDAQ